MGRPEGKEHVCSIRQCKDGIQRMTHRASLDEDLISRWGCFLQCNVKKRHTVGLITQENAHSKSLGELGIHTLNSLIIRKVGNDHITLDRELLRALRNTGFPFRLAA